MFTLADSNNVNLDLQNVDSLRHPTDTATLARTKGSVDVDQTDHVVPADVGVPLWRCIVRGIVGRWHLVACARHHPCWTHRLRDVSGGQRLVRPTCGRDQ